MWNRHLPFPFKAPWFLRHLQIHRWNSIVRRPNQQSRLIHEALGAYGRVCWCSGGMLALICQWTHSALEPLPKHYSFVPKWPGKDLRSWPIKVEDFHAGDAVSEASTWAGAGGNLHEEYRAERSRKSKANEAPKNRGWRWWWLQSRCSFSLTMHLALPYW